MDADPGSVRQVARRAWTAIATAAGQKYLEIRNNLTRFFEWRGCSFPEDHADETINRIAKRVAEGEEILNPSGYAMGVARLLLSKSIKAGSGSSRPWRKSGHASDVYVAGRRRRRSSRLPSKCLQTLSPDNRELILQYYQGEKGEKIQNRKKLLDRLGIPVNTLRMRALRLRERLQGCVEDA